MEIRKVSSEDTRLTIGVSSPESPGGCVRRLVRLGDKERGERRWEEEADDSEGTTPLLTPPAEPLGGPDAGLRAAPGSGKEGCARASSANTMPRGSASQARPPAKRLLMKRQAEG